MNSEKANFYLTLAEQASEQMEGPRGAECARQLEAEREGLEAAFDWFLNNRAEESALRMANALYYYWYTRGLMSEGREWYAKALAMPGASARIPARARALRSAALLAFRQNDLKACRVLNDESLAIWRELGDKSGIATELAELARIALREGNHQEVRRWAEESLALRQELGDEEGTDRPLHLLAASARMQGDYDRAADLYSKTSALYEKSGLENALMGESFNMGYVTLRQGDEEGAARHFRESLRYYRSRQEVRMVAACLAGLGGVALAEGDPIRAAHLLGAAQNVNEKLKVILDPDDQVEFERDLKATRGALGKNAFAEVWNVGRISPLEKMIEAAMGIGGQIDAPEMG
jgi:hypothetical protein